MVRKEFKRLRQSKDLSLKDLFGLTGISVQRLFAIEHRGESATPEEIDLIADAIGESGQSLKPMLDELPF